MSPYRPPSAWRNTKPIKMLAQALRGQAQSCRDAGQLTSYALWLRLAAQLGDESAQLQLAACLEQGVGVARQPAKAVHVLRRAADCGSLSAMLQLCRIYDAGEIVERDQTLVTHMLRRGAEQGHADSQFLLSNRLLRGLGVEVDRSAARAWLERAAAQRHPLAANVLMGWHLSGRAVENDAAKVAGWLDALPPAGELRRLWARVTPTPSEQQPQAPAPATASTQQIHLQACFFACYLLPRWYFEQRAQNTPLTLEALESAVTGLWIQAERLAYSLGLDIPTSRPPWCRLRSTGDSVRGLVLIHGARRAPDPAMVLLDSRGPDGTILLVERINDPHYLLGLAHIKKEGSHAVKGATEPLPPPTIERLLLETGDVPVERHVAREALLTQLMLYAEVDHHYQAAGQASDTPARKGPT